MRKVDWSSSLGGVALGLAIAGCLSSATPSADRVRVYERTDKPSVMAVYSQGFFGLTFGSPEILVKTESEYVSMKKYLSTIPSEFDRKIEEAQIEKLVLSPEDK